MVYQVLPGLTPDYLFNLMFGYFPYIPTPWSLCLNLYECIYVL